MLDLNELIYFPHHEPNNKHTRMSIYNRSAQFAAFKALVGYDEEIIKKGIISDKKVELEDDEKNLLDYKLSNSIDKEIIVLFYTINKNTQKEKYEEVKGILKKINRIDNTITIYINNIKDIISISDIIKIIN